jgi:hypothetical protein
MVFAGCLMSGMGPARRSDISQPIRDPPAGPALSRIGRECQRHDSVFDDCKVVHGASSVMLIDFEMAKKKRIQDQVWQMAPVLSHLPTRDLILGELGCFRWAEATQNHEQLKCSALMSRAFVLLTL